MVIVTSCGEPHIISSALLIYQLLKPVLNGPEYQEDNAWKRSTFTCMVVSTVTHCLFNSMALVFCTPLFFRRKSFYITDWIPPESIDHLEESARWISMIGLNCRVGRVIAEQVIINILSGVKAGFTRYASPLSSVQLVYWGDSRRSHRLYIQVFSHHCTHQRFSEGHLY